MPEEKMSFGRDVELLYQLDRGIIEKISDLLDKRDISITVLKRHVPSYFQRMLVQYSTILEKASEQAIKTGREDKEVDSFFRWFETNLPNIETKLGYSQLVDLSKQQLKNEGIEIRGSLSQRRETDAETLGIINAVRCIPFLNGADFTPSIRALFKNGEHVLLDSSGDWDDWTFVISCLLNALSNQAESLRNVPQAWEEVPWEKVDKRLKESKKSIRAFEKILKEKMPKSSKPKTKTAARRKRTRK